MLGAETNFSRDFVQNMQAQRHENIFKSCECWVYKLNMNNSDLLSDFNLKFLIFAHLSFYCLIDLLDCNCKLCKMLQTKLVCKNFIANSFENINMALHAVTLTNID